MYIKECTTKCYDIFNRDLILYIFFVSSTPRVHKVSFLTNLFPPCICPLNLFIHIAFTKDNVPYVIQMVLLWWLNKIIIFRIKRLFYLRSLPLQLFLFLNKHLQSKPTKWPTWYAVTEQKLFPECTVIFKLRFVVFCA